MKTAASAPRNVGVRRIRDHGTLGSAVGGTAYTDRLEFDRDFGQQEMKASGMTILPSWTFNDFDSAIQFVRDTPDAGIDHLQAEA